MGISFHDDVTHILLLGVSFMVQASRILGEGKMSRKCVLSF
jgi:hypothetical protein